MGESVRVAALFVERGGVYWDLPGVDPWDEARDARLYAGPWPVVAHPPCERWGRYWGGGPMLHGTPRQKIMGDDGGCFGKALAAVARWGGVLEHPEGSHAWAAHGIAAPAWRKGWKRLGPREWTCCVAQGNYGHRARKLTWLLCCGVEKPPTLEWSVPTMQLKLGDGYHSTEERARLRKTGICQRLSHGQRAATPTAFRDALLAIARSATGSHGHEEPDGDVCRVPTWPRARTHSLEPNRAPHSSKKTVPTWPQKDALGSEARNRTVLA